MTSEIDRLSKQNITLRNVLESQNAEIERLRAEMRECFSMLDLGCSTDFVQRRITAALNPPAAAPSHPAGPAADPDESKCVNE